MEITKSTIVFFPIPATFPLPILSIPPSLSLPILSIPPSLPYASPSYLLARSSQRRRGQHGAVWQVVETSTPTCLLAMDGKSGPLAPLPSPGAADGASSTTTPALASMPKKPAKGKSGGRDALPEHLVVPDKVFALAEQPACVLEGHQDDVLDLTWSKSDQVDLLCP